MNVGTGRLRWEQASYGNVQALVRWEQLRLTPQRAGSVADSLETMTPCWWIRSQITSTDETPQFDRIRVLAEAIIFLVFTI